MTEERLRFVARLLEGEGMSAEELQHTLADIRAYRAAVNEKQIEREAGHSGPDAGKCDDDAEPSPRQEIRTEALPV